MKPHLCMITLLTIALSGAIGSAADGWSSTGTSLREQIERPEAGRERWAALTDSVPAMPSLRAGSSTGQQAGTSGQRLARHSMPADGNFPQFDAVAGGVVPLGQQPHPAPVDERLAAELASYDAHAPAPTSRYARWMEGCPSWTCQFLPDGLMYHSYIAGPKEPRFGLSILDKADQGGIWEVALGGRMGIWRFGTTDPINPEGWQLDIEGAAFPRLNVDESQDVDATDYRFGVPFTYHRGDWRFKFGYYHLSSHVGDEYLVRNPDYERVNYVRESLILGSAYNLSNDVMAYGEIGYAFLTSDGAKPWEVQFGVEYTTPNARSPHGGVVLAANGHLREEVDWGGALSLIAGWQWRGRNSSKTFRVGLQYYNGKSLQYQFLDRNDELIGVGVWYDF